MADLLIHGIGSLVTNAGRRNGDVAVVAQAAVAVRDGLIVWAGAEADLPGLFDDLPAVDAGGRAVLPGFVDAHTHLVFTGDRSDEFARRLRGDSYEDILQAGGGILSTVAAVRAAGRARLVADSRDRARRLLAAGTTTAEVKSGYGLDTRSEVALLKAVGDLDTELAIDLVPTFLGAHVVPTEFRDDRDGYVDLVMGDMLEACAPLARFVDVFVDRGAFTVDEARRICAAAAARGLRPRLHVEQLTAGGGAALAADLQAVSADHLDHVDEDGAAALAAAGTVAVLLPAASFAMGSPQAPGRMIWDAGVTVALATDCNPGTSYTESMGFVIAVACVEMGLTPDEAVWAATAGGAAALGLGDRGRLLPGMLADLIILDAPNHIHLAYRPATQLVWKVFKQGMPAADSRPAGGG
ncbi:MAG: imidazolonepropionase [Acidimicrobiia bacterium]